MLWHKAIGAGGTGGGVVEYIGSVTKAGNDGRSWDTSGEALDVLSIAQTGDLVVIAFSFAIDADSTWSWVGMDFTSVYDVTSATNPGAYVGRRIVQAGDSNPYVSGVSGNWGSLSIVASVFRGVTNYENRSTSVGFTGLPNPPSLTANGKLWIATGHLDDDAVTNWTAPTNYTLADYAVGTGENRSSTVVAYRIESLSSDNPDAFGGSGTDNWRAVTLAFS